MESEFMTIIRLQYATTSTKNEMHCGRGCFEILASAEKSELTRRIFMRMRVKNRVWLALGIQGKVCKPRGKSSKNEC